jgi:hypothetical protein
MRLDKVTLLIAIIATALAVMLATAGGAVATVIGAVAAGIVAAALWQLRLDQVARVARIAEFEKRQRQYTLPGPSADGGITQFLRPEEEVVAFWPRSELAELLTWVVSMQHVGIQLVIGEAGAGKTRLARQLAAEAAGVGFETRWIGSGSEQAAVQAVLASGQPTLVVVDYAEICTGLQDVLTEIFSDTEESAIRVLLLARSAGEWWQQLIAASGYQTSELLAGVEPIMLGPVSSISHQVEVFEQAVAAFAAKLEVPCLDVQMTLNAPDAVVLVIHAAALLALLDNAVGESAEDTSRDQAEVLAGLLRHESRYWQQSQAARGLDLSPEVMQRIVAAGCLVGVDDEHSAIEFLAAFADLADPATRGKTARWLHDLYPVRSSTRGQPEWIGSLQPDLIAEQLIVTTLSQIPDLIPTLFHGLAERRALRALTTLARAALTTPAALHYLDIALRSDLENLTVTALAVAVETNPAVGNIIRDALSAATPSLPLFEQIVYALPDSSLTLAETAVIVLGHLVEMSIDAKADHAHWLGGLSQWLSTLGRLEDSLTAIEESVTLYRDLVRDQPDTFLPYLAAALGGHSQCLATLGRWEDALTASRESVTLYRELSDAFLNKLASALNAYSVSLAALGRREDALTASGEAITILRELARNHPDALRSLAIALTNQSGRLGELGRLEDAVTASGEAVTTYRELAQHQPDAFLRDLASALNNQAISLSMIGRREDALARNEEAITIRRKLAGDRPSAFLSDLAASLNNHSNYLASLGRREDALPPIEEALSIRRELARERPGTFLPYVAKSLSNYSSRLAALGRREDALAVGEEAVAAYRELARDRPDAFGAELSSTLSIHSAHLAMMNQPTDAVIASEEAVGICRRLVRDQPDAFLPSLANSLINYSNCLDSVGRWEDALAASEETITILRDLVRDQPDAFLDQLATSLNNHSAFLVALKRQDDALTAIEEAVSIRRELARDRPGVFLSDLALSIMNQSRRLAALGRWNEANAAIKEAVALRKLAPDRPDDFKYST